MTTNQANSTVSTLQVMTSSMVTVAVFSGFAQVLGVLMASAELGMAPLGQIPSEKGIADLRVIYGSDVVNKAISVVGASADIISLAMAVEGEALDKLRSMYGEDAVNKAIDYCGITEYECVKTVAKGLSVKDITPEKEEAVVKTGKRRGRQVAQPVKDTKTGIVYGSKAKAGMAVATEYGQSPTNHFAWYEVIKKDPKRFIRA